MESLDWRSFLARPALPPPPPQALDVLRRAPILITGAGGSIGSALALRLASLAPPMQILMEASESHLFALERAWTEAGAACPMTPILGSAADQALMEEIFSAHAPRIVFHAAAFKHVPLMEEQPLAAIANNIFGTETVARAAARHGARMVLLSTDKAVQPASVMGATKRVAERIVLAQGGTALRLGNVLASRDSVALEFARQIAAGGPVVVTDAAARRYFLTLDEAANLLLAAAVLEQRPALLAPVLPHTHLIADLARFMARELAPGRELAIDVTHPRPGDKQCELLWAADDRTQPAGLGAMVAIEPAVPGGELEAGLAGLCAALDTRNLSGALAYLQALASDFTPSEAVIALARQSNPLVYS
jgi:FlaA1/EpsC-like NDP-sugar epimerase